MPLPDALAGAAYAAGSDSPVHRSQVYVLGGEGVVSPAVMAEVEAALG